jgi:hypothetical protein
MVHNWSKGTKTMSPILFQSDSQEISEVVFMGVYRNESQTLQGGVEAGYQMLSGGAKHFHPIVSIVANDTNNVIDIFVAAFVEGIEE